MKKLIFVKDLIKLVVLVILFSIFGTSCGNDDGITLSESTVPRRIINLTEIYRFTFEEHDYLWFWVSGEQSVVHDPNCRKCKFDKSYKDED